MSIEQIRNLKETPQRLDYSNRYPRPNLIVPCLTLELFGNLHNELGVEFAIVDLDNFLVDAIPNNSGEYDMDAPSVYALQQARERGYLKEYFLLSNIQVALPYLLKRVEYFARILDTKFYHAATWPYGKPHPRAFQEAMKSMGAKPDQTVGGGDQLGKDVRAARAAGTFSILRYPHFGRDPFFRERKRRRERKVIQSFLEIG